MLDRKKFIQFDSKVAQITRCKEKNSIVSFLSRAKFDTFRFN